MDLDIYTTEMSKSVWDKAFFMDKIPGVKCVIDFGCADGAMIRYLSPLFPDIMFVGYDISKELINRARKTAPFYANNIYFEDAPFAGVAALTRYVTDRFSSDEICINFSSVLHEVYSSTGGIEVIRELIDSLKPRYITIRDMYCDEELPYNKDYCNIVDQLRDNKEIISYVTDFVHTFGFLKNWKDLTHLLMKLQWIDNGWEDELKENYYSWNIDKFIDDIGGEYIPSFECRYQLPYLAEKWKREYGWYNPDIHTHAQFILRRDD